MKLLLSSLFFKWDDWDSSKSLDEGVTDKKWESRLLNPGRLALESTLRTAALLGNESSWIVLGKAGARMAKNRHIVFRKRGKPWSIHKPYMMSAQGDAFFLSFKHFLYSSYSVWYNITLITTISFHSLSSGLCNSTLDGMSVSDSSLGPIRTLEEHQANRSTLRCSMKWTNEESWHPRKSTENFKSFSQCKLYVMVLAKYIYQTLGTLWSYIWDPIVFLRCNEL